MPAKLAMPSQRIARLLNQFPTMQPHQLQQLFDEHSSALVLYARQWCTLPDDAVQEAFIDLAKTHVEPDCPKSWLYTTARRKAQNIARAEQRRRTHHRAAAEQPSHQEHERWFHSTGATQLVAEDVVRGLALLSADERELLVARIWGDLSFEQLARLLNCSISSAHRRYSAALQHLKAAMTVGGHSLSNETLPKQNNERTLSPIAKLDSQTRLADGEV